MAIKVNLLPRDAAAARPGRAGLGISMPGVSMGGGLVVQIMTGALALVIVGLAVMGFLAWNAKAGFAKEVTGLKARNEALKSQLTELQQAEEAKLEIQRRLDAIGRVVKSQGVPVATLGGVLKAVPTGVWLTSFELKPQEAKVRLEPGRPAVAASSETLGRLEAKKAEVGAPPTAAGAGGPAREVTQLVGYSVVLKGRAFNNFQIADFMENLRKVGLFSDVDFVVTQAERVEQTRVVAFEVTASVKL